MDKQNLTLFRYRQANKYELYNLLNNEFWVSRPGSFNDPYDSTFFIDRKEIENHMSKLKEAKHYSYESGMSNEKFSDLICEKIISRTKKTVWIACFSEKINNPAMWANYSQNGRGFAIEYSHNSLEKMLRAYLEKDRKKYLKDYGNLNVNNVNHEFCDHVKKVNYAEEKYDGTEVISNLIDEGVTNKKYTPGELNDKSLDDFSYYTFYNKKKIWEYEKEWRMVLNTYNETKEEKEKMYINIQNKEDPIMPNAIYLGEFAEPFTKKVICNYCYKNKVKLYEMNSDIFDKKYELKYKEIYKNNMHDFIEKQ